MDFFDLHCDTIGECFLQNKSLFENDLHLDLKRAGCFESYSQVFAIWIPDELRGSAAFEYFLRAYDFYTSQISNAGQLKGFTPILAVEGGAVLGGEIERVKELSKRGVKILTLTWNGENELAGGAYSESGLKPFGKTAVKALEDEGIIIDASHLNKESFFDFARIASRPFIASHSNADIVNKPKGHRRNLTEEQIKVIRDFGGVIGLNFYTEFLDDENAAGVEALIRQIDYFSRISCENILAIGTDFDGCTICNELCGVEKLERVKEKLLLSGVGKALLDDIFYNNARRVIL